MKVRGTLSKMDVPPDLFFPRIIMAGMTHTMMWITIIDYQLVTSEQQVKQAPDNYSENGTFNNFMFGVSEV